MPKTRAKDLVTVVDRILLDTREEGGCMVTVAGRDGYGYAVKGFGGEVHRAHRLVAEHFYGPCPEGLQVRHLCGRGSSGCVTPAHLRYGTQSENMRDRWMHAQGLPPWPQEEVDRMRRLHDEIERLRIELSALEGERRRWAISQVNNGYLQSETARCCGVTRSRVNQWIREEAMR